MKNYETPEISVVELTDVNVILDSFQYIQKGDGGPSKDTPPLNL